MHSTGHSLDQQFNQSTTVKLNMQQTNKSKLQN